MPLKVRRTQCDTCIYRADSPLHKELPRLEQECRDKHDFLMKFRVCHHHSDEAEICCRGFWERHADACTPTQIAKRMKTVEFTNAESTEKQGEL